MEDIITAVNKAFDEYSDIKPYTSFDAIPVKDKESFFTVISVTKYETFDPVYSDNYYYLPVRAEVKLTVLAPQGSSSKELFDYYKANLEDVVNYLSKMKNGLKNMTVAPDTAGKRLALTATFGLDAIKQVRRPESW